MCRLVAALFAIFILVTPAAAQAFDFSFWPGPKTQKDPRFLRMTEMQCGDQAVARVIRVPAEAEREAIGTEPAMLISHEGKLLRKWRMPANSFPIATSGEELLFLSEGKVFAVRPDGRVRRSTSPRPHDYGQDDPACVVPTELSQRDFAYCRRFKDLFTRESVLLAYVGPCS